MASVKGCTCASQERAPVRTDPQIAALADGSARGGSASVEAGRKGRQPDPGLPPSWVVSNLATEDGSNKTAYSASFVITGEALPRWTGTPIGKDSFPQIHQ
jgi:hypothetical protein